MKHFLASLAAVLALTVPLHAASQAEIDELFDLMQTRALLAVMSDEGFQDGTELQQDMLGDRGGVAFEQRLAQIYSVDAMETGFRATFDAELAGTDIAPLLAFFATDTGQRVIRFEIEGRTALSDEAVEEAARTAYRQLAPEGRRLRLLTEFLELNDLVELNVAGAMTANLAFFRGMRAGGGFEMDEAMMLEQVWGQEEEIRADTSDWVTGYLTFAYDRLSDDELAAYIALSESPAGRALNRALFAGFYEMYTGISFDLGEAVSRFMVTEEL